jgi:hypothetical protein
MNSKIKETLQSRKFWLTVGTITMGVTLFLFGEIDIDKTIEIVRWAAGLYVGGLSVEDGFKRLAPTLLSLLQSK